MKKKEQEGPKQTNTQTLNTPHTKTQNFQEQNSHFDNLTRIFNTTFFFSRSLTFHIYFFPAAATFQPYSTPEGNHATVSRSLLKIHQWGLNDTHTTSLSLSQSKSKHNACAPQPVTTTFSHVDQLTRGGREGGKERGGGREEGIEEEKEVRKGVEGRMRLQRLKVVLVE